MVLTFGGTLGTERNSLLVPERPFSRANVDFCPSHPFCLSFLPLSRVLITTSCSTTRNHSKTRWELHTRYNHKPSPPHRPFPSTSHLAFSDDAYRHNTAATQPIQSPAPVTLISPLLYEAYCSLGQQVVHACQCI